MKATVLEVGGMLSVLDPQGVEKQLKDVPGVYGASVNIATNTAVIEYDEKLTTVEALRAKIIECGFHCRGEADRLAEVLSGLSAGDQVVLHPSDRIRQGVPVAQREIQ